MVGGSKPCRGEFKKLFSAAQTCAGKEGLSIEVDFFAADFDQFFIFTPYRGGRNLQFSWPHVFLTTVWSCVVLFPSTAMFCINYMFFVAALRCGEVGIWSFWPIFTNFSVQKVCEKSTVGRLIRTIHKILVQHKLIFFMENGDFWHIFKGKLHVLNVVTLGHQTFFETDFFVLLQEN